MGLGPRGGGAGFGRERACGVGGVDHVWDSSKARWFRAGDHVDAVACALAWAKDREVPLWSWRGSNMLLHGDVHALVLQVDIRGVDVSPQGRQAPSSRLGPASRGTGL